MAFDLCFSPEFYGDVYEFQSDRIDEPTNIADAVCSVKALNKRFWDNLAYDVFGLENGDCLAEITVFEKILETNTCSNLDSPIKVWIDEKGLYILPVYDK